MTTIHELLQAILHLIRTGCNAEAVSLFILIPTAEGDHPLLIHDGAEPAVPELANIETAEHFVASVTSGEQIPEMVASSNPEGRLTLVPSLIELLENPVKNRTGSDRRGSGSRACPGVLTDPGNSAWLGIRGGDPVSPQSLLYLARDGKNPSLHLAIGSLIGCRTQMVCTTDMDPISQLPSRSAYPISYRRFAKAASENHTPGLLLVNPDFFNDVNDRFNREIGDRVIREIADRLSMSVRTSDFVFRYGAAMFGVLLPDTDPEIIRQLADNVRDTLSGEPYHGGKLSLSFSLGGVVAESQPGDGDQGGATELARRADAALSTEKRSGGRGFTLWTKAIGTEEANRLDSLSGIFTADPVRDYRNMRLLWDTLRLISSSTNVEEMMEDLLQELVSVFSISAAGVYHERSTDIPWKILRRAGNKEDVEWRKDSKEDACLTPIRKQVMSDGKTFAQTDKDSDTFLCVIPLSIGDQTVGCLYLEGNARLFQVSSSDLVFFEALAEQIAMALDRSRLTAMEIQQHKQSRLKLQNELDELQNTMKRSSLIFRSESMEQLLRIAKRLAATDTTVLINGESGTGKEVLARTIHQLSKRNKKPLVVVDCSAITTSLIDSELFGHERGAFTGADRRSDGRLLEADGGTVLLDEIGELPLEVQSKLLRFVQEKQFTRVGSNQSRTVDVRIIALTNRDLAAEAKAGRFREDLYHRLNVMRMVVPSLRDRTEDIEYLATHFIKTFALRYDRDVTGLTPEGREALLSHTWPGNVRELQNRIMRAVVLAESVKIGPVELEFQDPSTSGMRTEHASNPSPSSPQDSVQETDPWDGLKQSLSQEIDRITAEEAAYQPPVGKWLHEDMVLEASRSTGNITTRAAELLGIPETTFRRKLKIANSNIAAGISSRPADWEEIHHNITIILESGNPDQVDLLEQARSCILETLAEKVPGNIQAGAALMGITETTFKKWLPEETS